MNDYKSDDKTSAAATVQVKEEQPLVVISGRGSLSLNMQNPSVVQSLYDSLNPEREKNIISLQAEINHLRKLQRNSPTVSYNNAASSYKVEF